MASSPVQRIKLFLDPAFAAKLRDTMTTDAHSSCGRSARSRRFRPVRAQRGFPLLPDRPRQYVSALITPGSGGHCIIAGEARAENSPLYNVSQPTSPGTVAQDRTGSS